MHPCLRGNVREGKLDFIDIIDIFVVRGVSAAVWTGTGCTCGYCDDDNDDDVFVVVVVAHVLFY